MTLNSKKLLSMGKELFKKYKNKTVCAMQHVNLSSLCAILSCSIVDSLQLLDWSPPGSIHGDSPGKNTGVGCHALLQRIFPTQGSNPGLPHCRHVVYHLSHQGSPRILEWVALSLLQGNFPTQESNQGLLHCKWLIYQLSYLGSP